MAAVCDYSAGTMFWQMSCSRKVTVLQIDDSTGIADYDEYLYWFVVQCNYDVSLNKF